MSNVMIDNKEYEIEQLGEDTKQQLNALKMIDGEIRRLQLQLSIANSAKNYHAQMLKATMPGADPLGGDTIKLG